MKTPSETLHWPTAIMSPELEYVLGRPNFWCGPIAHLFRDAGIWPTLEHRAHAEQARVIFWMVGLVLQHGTTWRDHAEAAIAEARERLKAAPTGLYASPVPPGDRPEEGSDDPVHEDGEDTIP